MSKTIDERVVEMRFDNKEFEKNVAATRKSLRGLDEDLAFKNASKGFRSIENSSDDVNFDKLSNALTTVTGKFSTLEIIGITALQNITNKAINAGLELVKSLTIEPLEQSWSGFENLTMAVQALVGSGKVTMDEANEIVEAVQWFSDETSASLQGMVDAVGKLVTTANLSGDQALAVAEGINTLAISAGRNSAIAERSLGHLTRGLSDGKLSLGEWSYAFEDTGIATGAFRDALIEAGLEAGTLAEKEGKVFVVAKKLAETDMEGLNAIVDGIYRANGEMGGGLTDIEVTAQNIRETLTDGEWVTTEVLMQALKPYFEGADAVRQWMEDNNFEGTSSDAIAIMRSQGYKISEEALHFFEMGMEAVTMSQAIESGFGAVQKQWIAIFGDIFGTYEQQKVLWTDVANGLWDIFAEPVSNIESAFSKFGELTRKGNKPIEEAEEKLQLRLAWNKKNGIELTEEETEKLRENYIAAAEATTGVARVADTIRNFLSGIYNFSSGVVDAIRSVIWGTSDIEDAEERAAATTAKLTEKINQIVDKMHAWSESFANNEEAVERFKKVAVVAFKLIANPIKSVAKIIKTIGSVFKDVFGDLFPKKDDIYGVVDSLDSFADSLVISEDTLYQIGRAAYKVLTYVRGFLEDIWPKVKSAFETLKNSFLKKFPVLLDDTVKPFDKFKSVLSAIYDTVKNKISKLAAPFMTFLDPVIDKFKTFKNTIFEKGKSIFNTIKEDVTSFGDAVKKAWTSIVDFFKSLNIDWKVVTAVGLAASALILMLIIYDIYWTIKYRIMTLADAAKEVMESFAGVLDGLKSSLDAATLAIVAVGIVILSIAIFNLYLVFKQLSKMSWDEIEKASVAMAVLAGVVAVFSWGTKVLLANSKNIISVAFGLLFLAAGLTAMIAPIAKLYTLSKQIGVGALIGIVTGILAAVAILVLISKMAGSLKSLQGAVALLAFVASIGLLEIEILLISRYTKQATEGLLSMLLLIGALSLVTLAMKALNKVEFGKIAFKIMAIAIALTLLTISAIVLGLVPIVIIGKGVAMLLLLSVAFLAIGAAAKLLGAASKKMLIAAVAILTIAASIAAIGYAIYYFSDTQWENIKNGVIYVSSIAGALIGIVAILALITRIGKGDKALLGAGVAIVALAAGILAIAGAIKILSGIGTLDESVISTFVRTTAIFILGAIAIVGLIAKTNSNTASKALLTASVMILSLGVLALSISGALIGLSLIKNIDETTLWFFAGIVLTLVGALSVMVAYISKSYITNLDGVFKGLALSILSLSVLMLTIVAVLAILQNIKINENTFWAFAGILAAFLGLIITVTALLRNEDAMSLADDFKALSLLAGVFSLSIVAIALALSALNGVGISGTTLAAVIAAIALFVGGIITIVAILNNVNAASLLPKVAAISLLAVSLGASIAGIIAAVSLLNGTDFSGTTLSAVIVAIIALVGAIIALSLLSKAFDVGGLLAVSAATISMAAAIMAIGIAVQMIQSVDGVGTLWALFGVMALLLTLMVVAGVVVGLIPGASIAILAVGGAMIMAAASMLLIALSTQIFIDVIIRLVEWINQLAEKAGGFKELGEQVVNDLVDFLVGFATTLRERAPEIGAALEDILIALLEILGTFLANLVTDIWEGLKKIWPKVAEFFKGIWERFPEWFREMWTKLKEKCQELWDKVSAWFGDLWGSFIDWGKNIIDGIREGIRAAWNGLKKFFANLINGLLDKIDFLDIIPRIKIDDIDDSALEEAMEQSGSNAGKGFTNGLTAGLVEAQKATRECSKNIDKEIQDFWDINSPSKVTREDGEYVGQGFEQGVTDSLDGSRKPIKDSMQRVADDFDKSADKSSSSIIDKLKEKFDLSAFDIKDLLSGDFSSFDLDSLGINFNDIDLSSLLSGLPVDGEETELNFTAVVDSSQIDALYSDLGGTTSVPVGSYTTNMAYDTSASVSRSSDAGVEKVFSRGEITDTGTIIYNTFQVNGDNAQELADEIASILQGQIERKGNTWA